MTNNVKALATRLREADLNLPLDDLISQAAEALDAAEAVIGPFIRYATVDHETLKPQHFAAAADWKRQYGRKDNG